jgi:hypothetical protein
MRKSNTKEFIKKSKSIFGNQYDYSKVDYINSRTEVIIICKKHKEFKIAPGPHLSYQRGCYICDGIRHDQSTFLNKCALIHGDTFDYSKTIFTKMKEPIIIICKKKNHGEFTQIADKHVNGKQGCPKCKKSAIKNKEYFLTAAKEINGDKYDYSKVNYINMNTKVIIFCKNHGNFEQTPVNHINHKNQCPKCITDSTRLTLEQFICKAKEIHGDKYDYSKVEYINSKIKIIIKCKKHGDFNQSPGGHLRGNGCGKCANNISIRETEWLNYLNIFTKNRNITIFAASKIYKVDAYDPITNTIYEFYGDYWHGNPSIYNPKALNKHNKMSFGTLFKKTIKRERELIKLGYMVVTIWESEWLALKRKCGDTETSIHNDSKGLTKPKK